MAHYMNNGYDWLWMVPMMLLWVLIIGALLYGVIRIADKPRPR